MNYYHSAIIIALGISTLQASSIRPRGIHRFNLPYNELNGLTLTLTVSDGAIVSYASINYRDVNQFNYDWNIVVRYPGRQEVCLDPSIFQYGVDRPRVFITIVGIGISHSRYTLNSTMVGTSAIGG